MTDRDAPGPEVPDEPKQGAPLPEVPRCPVCGEAFARSTLVLCRDCAAPHHRRCWSFNKGCATYACQCRTFVLPPVGAGDDLEFSTRGYFGPSVYLALMGGFTAAMLVAWGGAWALTGFGSAEALHAIMITIWACLIGLVPLAPLLTEKHYLVSPEDEAIHLEMTLGSLKLLTRRNWKTFHDVQGLELQTTKSHGQQGEQKRLEVWLREVDGSRHCIDSSIWEDRDEVLTKVDASADLLDTTVSLPRSISATRSLPAGLGRAIALLPRKEDGEDEAPE